MSFKYTPPKYAQLIAELERRIESGEYPPGSPLPSEHQLMAEFGMARPTVVKALGVLRDQGWIVTHQGKGRFVRGRPAIASGQQTRMGRELLDRKEAQVESSLLSAGPVPAPNRIAAYLNIEPKSPVVLRKILVTRDDEASEISSTWVPADVAEGTPLTGTDDLKQGGRRYVEAALRRSRGRYPAGPHRRARDRPQPHSGGVQAPRRQALCRPAGRLRRRP